MGEFIRGIIRETIFGEKSKKAIPPEKRTIPLEEREKRGEMIRAIAGMTRKRKEKAVERCDNAKKEGVEFDKDKGKRGKEWMKAPIDEDIRKRENEVKSAIKDEENFLDGNWGEEVIASVNVAFGEEIMAPLRISLGKEREENKRKEIEDKIDEAEKKRIDWIREMKKGGSTEEIEEALGKGGKGEEKDRKEKKE